MVFAFALKMPLGDLGEAVAVDEVGSQGAHESIPVAKVLRRLGQPLVAAGGAEGVVALARVAPLARAVAAVGEELRHEGELHDGADAKREQVVVHPVDVVPAVLALVVHHRHVVVQQPAAQGSVRSTTALLRSGWQACGGVTHCIRTPCSPSSSTARRKWACQSALVPISACPLPKLRVQ